MFRLTLPQMEWEGFYSLTPKLWPGIKLKSVQLHLSLSDLYSWCFTNWATAAAARKSEVGFNKTLAWTSLFQHWLPFSAENSFKRDSSTKPSSNNKSQTESFKWTSNKKSESFQTKRQLNPKLRKTKKNWRFDLIACSKKIIHVIGWKWVKVICCCA